MNLLELENVSFRYPDGGVGLNGCSLSIQRESRNALLGVNGSGKITLFQHTNGLLRPQSGVLRYAGEPVDYSRGGLRELRSRVGIIFRIRIGNCFWPACRRMFPVAHLILG